MSRWLLRVEYDGSAFCGWQRQQSGLAVQTVLAAAVKAVDYVDTTRECSMPESAGRTDSGVHAIAMPVHIDMQRPMEDFRLVAALNAHLRPHKVAVLAAEAVADDFHARFSCKGRHYRYVILNRMAPAILARERVWHVHRPLDIRQMQEAANYLLGQHDFSSFRAAGCQAASPLKNLDRLHISQQGDEIWIDASARSFLYHQVRNMVGTLAEFGVGKWQAEYMQEILAMKNRHIAGATAPACGLYFAGADY
ncbi:MAG: tRNA pseudouridine(38-40) synthase TruA [Alphaproteobacteria bacterium]